MLRLIGMGYNLVNVLGHMKNVPAHEKEVYLSGIFDLALFLTGYSSVVKNKLSQRYHFI